MDIVVNTHAFAALKKDGSIICWGKGFNDQILFNSAINNDIMWIAGGKYYNTDDVGICGKKGLKGERGDDGKNGLNGLPGTKGDMGDAGGNGLNGLPGIRVRTV